jgi:hypothetical protein
MPDGTLVAAFRGAKTGRPGPVYVGAMGRRVEVLGIQADGRWPNTVLTLCERCTGNPVGRLFGLPR